jgi:hypothetical protein
MTWKAGAADAGSILTHGSLDRLFMVPSVICNLVILLPPPCVSFLFLQSRLARLTCTLGLVSINEICVGGDLLPDVVRKNGFYMASMF